MNRYQIQLDEETASEIRAIARKRGVSFSHVVREAIGAYRAGTDAETTLAERWAEAIGRGRDIDGRTDVSTKHDEFAWDH